MITEVLCRELDGADPVASVRRRFNLPAGVVYLDGNSLGALPASVPARIERLVRDEWGNDLIRSWDLHRWVDLPGMVGAKLARLLGAAPDSVVACDSTTVNLFKVTVAALRLHPKRHVVLTDSGNFPTDLYVLQGIPEATLRMVEPEKVEAALDDEVAVLALSQVDYRTGRLHDLAALTASAHEAGALSVWDLSHSAGVIPIDLEGAQVDFAVGCGYKFLNGGPGAPAYVYIAPAHQSGFDNPIAGWFGHASPFDFETEFVPAEGIDRAKVGTPHVLSLVALDEALSVFDEVEMSQVKAKSERMTGLFIELCDQELSGFGLEVASPRGQDRRGSQVSLRHPQAQAIIEALAERGVIGDYRKPDLARFGFAPLYVRYIDVWRAAQVLREVMEGAWENQGRLATID